MTNVKIYKPGEMKKIVGERLSALMEKTGISMRSLAKMLGMSYPVMLKMVKGVNLPRAESLVKVADWFAVPLDYLCGRCDEETARKILEDYPSCFMALRRSAYEEYIGSRQRLMLKNKDDIKTNELPWPYNLMIELVPDWKEGKISEKVERGLEDAISLLNKKEGDFIIQYYKNGKLLEEIGNENNVSKQWVWYVINRGMKRLKFMYGRFWGNE